MSSVANEYTGYVTTPEEYTRQYYEGGHTIYGPNTLPFLAAQAARLARDLDERASPPHRSPSAVLTSKSTATSPSPNRHRRTRRFGTAPVRRPDQDRRRYWEIAWLDAVPGDLAWHEPLVRVEDDAKRVVADDQWGAIEVTYVGDHRYRVRWYDPAFGAAHRFVLCANAGRPETASDLFD